MELAWRGPLGAKELSELLAADGGDEDPGRAEQARRHCLGWVTARTDGALVGYAAVAWDGGRHAFLLDPTVHPDQRRAGLGTLLVRRAVEEAGSAGCEWLHVDFEPHLQRFYLDACGFSPTRAGVLRLD